MTDTSKHSTDVTGRIFASVHNFPRARARMGKVLYRPLNASECVRTPPLTCNERTDAF